MLRHVIVLVALTLAVSACNRPSTPAPSTTSAPGGASSGDGAPAKPLPAELPPVVARVNGEDIQKSDLERAIRNLEGQAGQPVPAERKSEVYRNLLDQLVGFTLLKQESNARKVAVPDADVESQLAQYRKQFPDEQAFTKALGAQNMTVERLKDETRANMAVSKMLEAELSPKIAVQEKDVADFYAQNPDKFKQEESVRASHILIRINEKADAAAKAKARARAEDVLKQARGGADFAALAKEHSADGSAAQGGDLGYFSRGQMVPPFEKAAFALKPGEISDVVESQFGFHIIKLADRRPARTVPLTEVGGRINQYLLEQKRQQLTDEFVAKLKEKGRIEILI